MATVNANRPCGIAFDDGTRVELRVGLNEDVPDAVKTHPYFKALEADGDVMIIAGKPGRKASEKDAE